MEIVEDNVIVEGDKINVKLMKIKNKEKGKCFNYEYVAFKNPERIEIIPIVEMQDKEYLVLVKDFALPIKQHVLQFPIIEKQQGSDIK